MRDISWTPTDICGRSLTTRRGPPARNFLIETHPNDEKPMASKKLSAQQSKDLLALLKTRFEKNMKRHPDAAWTDVQKRLEKAPDKLWSLHQMEESGGEPDVVAMGGKSGDVMFVDCAAESPKGRRSLCYDAE